MAQNSPPYSLPILKIKIEINVAYVIESCGSSVIVKITGTPYHYGNIVFMIVSMDSTYFQNNLMVKLRKVGVNVLISNRTTCLSELKSQWLSILPAPIIASYCSRNILIHVVWLATVTNRERLYSTSGSKTRVNQ
jgi:hypothetical protein